MRQFFNGFRYLGIVWFLMGLCFAAPTTKPFLMPISDVYHIAGQGTVVMGQIEHGRLTIGDSLEILGFGETQKTKATVILLGVKEVQDVKELDKVSVVLQGVEVSTVSRGQVLVASGSIKPSTQFKAIVHMLTSAEGSRKTPVASGYRPQVFYN